MREFCKKCAVYQLSCEDCEKENEAKARADEGRKASEHRAKLFGVALCNVLIAAGVIRADSQPTGPELLMAAEGYVEAYFEFWVCKCGNEEELSVSVDIEWHVCSKCKRKGQWEKSE